MSNHIKTFYEKQGLQGLILHPGGIWTGSQKFVSEEQMAQWNTKPGVENILKSTEPGVATSVLTTVYKNYEGKERLYLNECETMEQEGDGDSEYAKWAFDKNKENRLYMFRLA